jgi:glycosyltransferase involved in cell wall biosynthesis
MGLKGRLDSVEWQAIAGWAFDPDQPDEPVLLEILDNDVPLCRLAADRYREDLEKAGLGSGRCSFRLRIPEGLSAFERHVIAVRRASDGAELPGSPIVLERDQSVFDEHAERTITAMVDHAIAAAEHGEDTEPLLRHLLEQADALLAAEPDPEGRSAAMRADLRMRWRGLLPDLPKPPGDSATILQFPPRPHDTRRQAIFIDMDLPMPDRDGGSNAALGHLGALVRLGWRVRFTASRDLARVSPYAEQLEALGVECCLAPFYGSVEEVLRRHGERAELVYLHRMPNATRYAAMAREYCRRARILYSVADLNHLRLARQAAIENRRELLAEARAVRARELMAAASVDAVITHSEHEAELLRQAARGLDVHVIPWPAEPVPRETLFAERSGVAFIGGFDHAPNRDAAQFLIDEIMPRVRARRADITCLLVGSAMPPDFSVPRDGIVPLGHVPDLATVLDRVRLTAAPLRYGAGLKQKVVQSLAAGLPCVCTSVAAEGMSLPPLLARYVADDADTLADMIVALHENEAANAEYTAAALVHVRRQFSPERVDDLMRRAVRPRVG